MPFHLRSLNSGANERVISFLDGYWTFGVPSQPEIPPRSNRRNAFFRSSWARYQRISQGTKRPSMHRKTGARGLSKPARFFLTAESSSTQFSPEKFEKAPSNGPSPLSTPISSVAKT